MIRVFSFFFSWNSSRRVSLVFEGLSIFLFAFFSFLWRVCVGGLELCTCQVLGSLSWLKNFWFFLGIRVLDTYLFSQGGRGSCLRVG